MSSSLENSGTSEPSGSPGGKPSWETPNEHTSHDSAGHATPPGLEPEQPSENPPWTFVEIVRLVYLSVFVLIITGLVAGGIALSRHGTEAAEELSRDPWVAVPAQFIAYLVIIGLMVFMVRGYAPSFWRAIRWNWPVARWVAFLAAGGILALVVQAVSALLPVPKSLPIEHYFREPGGAWLMAAFGVSLAPLVEELFFRGFLYPVVARSTGMLAAILITGATFAGIHGRQLGFAWGPLTMLLIVGLILTAVRAQTRSVAASFLVHVGYNTMLFTLMYISSGGFQNFNPPQ